MREITTHHINGKHHNIKVFATDEPGSGNAHHEYSLETRETAGIIHFQNGPVNEVGINGISNESLLAIVIDRLQCFQTSKFSCRENALALTKLEEAMHWLKHRTELRINRGIEGTHQV